MAPTPTYCDTDVASAAPATPQPSPKMNRMSIRKFATLDSTAEYRGVLQGAAVGVSACSCHSHPATVSPLSGMTSCKCITPNSGGCAEEGCSLCILKATEAACSHKQAE